MSQARRAGSLPGLRGRRRSWGRIRLRLPKYMRILAAKPYETQAGPIEAQSRVVPNPSRPPHPAVRDLTDAQAKLYYGVLLRQQKRGEVEANLRPGHLIKIEIPEIGQFNARMTRMNWKFAGISLVDGEKEVGAFISSWLEKNPDATQAH